MNLKRVLAAVTAAAVAAASVSVSAFATLLPIEKYNVTADISGVTVEQLENYPVKSLMDCLKYAADYTVTVSQNSSASQQSSEILVDGVSTGEVTADTAETSAETEESTADTAEASAGTQEVSENTAETPAATAETSESTEEVPASADDIAAFSGETSGTTEITYKRGDPVQFPADAVKVWVDGSQYSIVGDDSTVDLSDFVSGGTATLIVGSGKQLDPSNVAYIITFNVDALKYTPTFSVKYYSLDEDGNKVYLDLADQSVSLSYLGTYTNVQTYLNRRLVKGETIYVEVTSELKRSDNDEVVEAEFKYDYGYSGDKNVVYNPNYTINSFIDVDYTYALDDGTQITNSHTVYAYLYGVGISVDGSIRSGSAYIYSSISSKMNSDSIGVFDEELTYDLDPGYPANDTYNYKLSSIIYYPDRTNLKSVLKKSVVGRFDTIEAAADAQDITSSLTGNGYEADYSSGVDFTIFINGSDVPEIATKDGDEYLDYVVHMKITVTSEYDDDGGNNGPVIGNSTLGNDKTNAFFRLSGVNNTNEYFVLDDKTTQVDSHYHYLDSYYKYNYQTVFIYDEDNTYDMSTVMLNVSSPTSVNVYDSVSGKLVKLDEEPQNLSGGPKQYTVAASNNQGNYTVHAVKNTTGGAKLFVNGPSEREVFFDNSYDMFHDILVANIGDQELTGLKVELSDAQNVKLDSYWVIGGEKNDTLAPFTKVSDSYYSVRNVSNLAKIRLLPDGEGKVSGKLTISADGQEPVEITLKGNAGNPKIVTNPELADGVKYVPYYAVVATNNIHDWNKVTFRLWSGSLPQGVSFDSETGELYGVPQETGSFTFTICAQFSESSFSRSYQEFKLNILDNTDDNVYEATDADYDLITPIGTEQNNGKYDFGIGSIDSDQLFVSKGTYGEFQALWINGEKMTPDVDYTSESGSTRITIRSQTLKNKLTSKTGNTIAAEFRVSGSNEVRRTAQNVYINVKGGNNGGSNGGNSGGSTGGNVGGGSAGGSGHNSNVDRTPGLLDGSTKGWDDIKKRISGMTTGTINIDMNGSSLLSSDVTSLIKGKDITLVLISDDGELTVNGRTVTEAKNTGVEIKRSSTVPSSTELSGGLSKTAFTVGNNGTFGYTGVVKFNLGSANAGKIANIYITSGGTSKCVAAVKISSGGSVSYAISEGGEYTVVVDDISRLEGDANGDLAVNSLDSAVILRYVTNKVTLDSAKLKYCDINKDGKVNALDASAILRNSVR